jgi:hypothetical protein
LMGTYFCAISNDYYDTLKDFVLYNCNKSQNYKIFKDCINYIELISNAGIGSEVIKVAWSNIVDLQTNHLCKMTDSFENLIRIIHNKIKSIDLLPAETVKYSIQSQNNDKYIKSVLSRLLHPFKSPHYDEMYKRLEGLNCTISTTSQYILVRDNRTNISALIFNEGNSKPQKWFKYYTYNIGKKDKCDPKHMFPFFLDKNLSEIKCCEKITADVVNKFGKVQKLYFFGMLIHEKKCQLGVFEYFIDAMSSLFHRFFKPYSQISDKMKKTIMANFPTDYSNRYKMAKELIKSF